MRQGLHCAWISTRRINHLHSQITTSQPQTHRGFTPKYNELSTPRAPPRNSLLLTPFIPSLLTSNIPHLQRHPRPNPVHIDPSLPTPRLRRLKTRIWCSRSPPAQHDINMVPSVFCARRPTHPAEFLTSNVSRFSRNAMARFPYEDTNKRDGMGFG